MIKIKKRSRITYYLKSGDRYTFTASSFRITYQGDQITKISWEGAKGAPFHTILNDISLVITENYWVIGRG